MFLTDFYEHVGTIPAEVSEPLRRKFLSLQDAKPSREHNVIARSDMVFGEGTFIPIIYAGARVRGSDEWADDVEAVLNYLYALNLDVFSGMVMYKTEVSIVPPGERIRWHHDIYLKDKLCDRVHIPIVTNNTRFYSKWHADERVYSYQFAQNEVYRFNNRVPHTIVNGAEHNRFHLLLNFMRKDVFDFLKAKNLLSYPERALRCVTTNDEEYYMRNPKCSGTLETFRVPHPKLSEKQLSDLVGDNNTIDDLFLYTHA